MAPLTHFVHLLHPASGHHLPILHILSLIFFFVFCFFFHMDVRSYRIYLSLIYFTWHNVLRGHPFYCQWQYFLLFMTDNIPYIVYIHKLCFLYPFIHQWTLSLFPYLGYCKQCCNECGEYIFSSWRVFFFPLG